MPDVARYEPRVALFARRRRPRRDPPAGRRGDRAPFLALEHGEGQADAVEALAARGGLRRRSERIRDLAGHRARVAVRARR